MLLTSLRLLDGWKDDYSRLHFSSLPLSSPLVVPMALCCIVQPNLACPPLRKSTVFLPVICDFGDLWLGDVV